MRGVGAGAIALSSHDQSALRCGIEQASIFACACARVIFCSAHDNLGRKSRESCTCPHKKEKITAQTANVIDIYLPYMV
jgi:hypothetical protein